MRYTFGITPVPQGRPRFVKRGAFVQTYDPKTSKEFKQTLKKLALQQSPTLSESALEVSIVFYMSIPKSKPKKWREQAARGEEKCTVHKDLDNLAKSVLDALTGIMWKDDSQIVTLKLYKVYSDAPRIEMEVTESHVKAKRINRHTQGVRNGT